MAGWLNTALDARTAIDRAVVGALEFISLKTSHQAGAPHNNVSRPFSYTMDQRIREGAEVLH